MVCTMASKRIKTKEKKSGKYWLNPLPSEHLFMCWCLHNIAQTSNFAVIPVETLPVSSLDKQDLSKCHAVTGTLRPRWTPTDRPLF